MPSDDERQAMMEAESRWSPFEARFPFSEPTPASEKGAFRAGWTAGADHARAASADALEARCRALIARFEYIPLNGLWGCPFCDRISPEKGNHDTTCPWPALLAAAPAEAPATRETGQ